MLAKLFSVKLVSKNTKLHEGKADPPCKKGAAKKVYLVKIQKTKVRLERLS